MNWLKKLAKNPLAKKLLIAVVKAVVEVVMDLIGVLGEKKPRP